MNKPVDSSTNHHFPGNRGNRAAGILDTRSNFYLSGSPCGCAISSAILLNKTLKDEKPGYNKSIETISEFNPGFRVRTNLLIRR